MDHFRSAVSRLSSEVLILLLAAAPYACRDAARHEPMPGVPITTKSKEARRLFLEGYAKAQNWHAEEAHRLFAQSIAKDPDFAQAYSAYGESASDPKVREEGIKKALSLAHLVSKGEQLLFAANQAWFLENDQVKGTELFRQIAEMYPDNKAAQLWLAMCLGLGRQDFEKAIPQFEKALALDEEYFPTHNWMAYTYLAMGDYAKAEEHFKIYQRLQPKEANPHDCLGDVYMKMGRFDEAIDHYGQAVALDPQFGTSQSKIGVSLIFKGQYAEGRQALEKAKTTEISPLFQVNYEEAIARSYIYAGDHSKALEAADAAIGLARQAGMAGEAALLHLGKCAILCELKNYAAAGRSIADCRECLSDPSAPADAKQNTGVASYFWEVILAAERKDFAGAETKLADLKAAISKANEPFLSMYADAAPAFILLARGDHTGADAQFAKVKVPDPFFMYYAAAAKEKAGNPAGAKEIYSRVANWNEDTLWYAFVRNKAKAKI